MSLDGSVARPGDPRIYYQARACASGAGGATKWLYGQSHGLPTPARSAFFWHITGRDESECPAEKRPSRSQLEGAFEEVEKARYSES